MSEKLTREERNKRVKDETKEYVKKAYIEGKRYNEISKSKLPIHGVILKNSVNHHFRNIVELCNELGIPANDFVSPSGITRYYASLLTKQEVDSFLKDIHRDEDMGRHAKEVIKETGRAVEVTAAKRVYGSWDMALYRNGITPPRITDKKLVEEITPKVLEIYKKCTSITETSTKTGASWHLVKDILKNNNVEIIYKSEWFRNEIPPLAKHEVDTFIRKVIAESTNCKYTVETLEKEYPHETYSIKKYYKNISTAFMESGEYLIDKQVPRAWSNEILKEQILLGHKLGKRLNSSYLQYGAGSSVLRYARDEFGSWERAISWAGLDYRDITLEEKGNSDLGREFENTLDEILTELGIGFKKEDHDIYKPDYVIGSEWMDAKLSEYTYLGKDRNGQNVIDKYEPHCDKLTLVFLLGNEATDRYISEKTRLVHVSKYVGMLPEDKQAYYGRRLDEIKQKIRDRNKDAVA